MPDEPAKPNPPPPRLLKPIEQLETAGAAYAHALVGVIDAAWLAATALPDDRARADRLVHAADAEAARLHNALRAAAERVSNG